MMDIPLHGLLWAVCLYATLGLGVVAVVLQPIAVLLVRRWGPEPLAPRPLLDAAIALVGPGLCLGLGAVVLVLQDGWIQHDVDLRRRLDEVALALPIVGVAAWALPTVLLFLVGRALPPRPR